MQQLTKVRKFSDGRDWVVDIVAGNNSKRGYGQPNGTAGMVFFYPRREDALAAEKLYLERHGVPISGKISAGKPTNPKDVLGVRKAPVSTLSVPVLFEMGLGMLEGARKYGRHNYRAMGVSATVYYDAAMGHLMDWFEGEDIDPDSGLSHVTKAMTALSVLRDSMLMGNWKDDRPIRNPHKLNKKRFNIKAEEIIDKYPDCKAPYLETDSEDRKCGKTI